MAGLGFNQVVVNMGPQHPSTHGVLRLVVTLDGELVKDVIPVDRLPSPLLREDRREAHLLPVHPVPDRTEYVAGMNCEWGYVLTVEKLAGIRPTRRAEFIRVIMAELNRIASHQVGVGTFVADLAPLGTAMVFYAFRHREKILDLLEAASGARMMFNYFRFGGVRYDLPDGWVEQCREPMLKVPAWCDEYEALVNDNAVFLQRCMGKGVITQRRRRRLRHHRPQRARLRGRPRPAPHAALLGLSRARLRGLHRPSTATCSTATWCASTRCASPRRSCCSASTCCRPGRYSSAPCGRPTSSRRRRAPVTSAQENPRGEFGTYIVSDGSRYPYRLKYRDPCFVQPADLSQAAARQQDRRRGRHLGEHGYRPRRDRPLMGAHDELTSSGPSCASWWRSSSPTPWSSSRRS